MISYQRILVPTDFGKAAARAADMAIGLAERFGATITLVHAYEIPSYATTGFGFTSADLVTPVREAAEEELAQCLSTVKSRWPDTVAMLRCGPAWSEIMAAADEVHPDLIVMGTHGRHGIGRALLGSVAEKLVRMSRVPVLTIRGEERGDRAREGASHEAI